MIAENALVENPHDVIVIKLSERLWFVVTAPDSSSPMSLMVTDDDSAQICFRCGASIPSSASSPSGSCEAVSNPVSPSAGSPLSLSVFAPACSSRWNMLDSAGALLVRLLAAPPFLLANWDTPCAPFLPSLSSSLTHSPRSCPTVAWLSSGSSWKVGFAFSRAVLGALWAGKVSGHVSSMVLGEVTSVTARRRAVRLQPVSLIDFTSGVALGIETSAVMLVEDWSVLCTIFTNSFAPIAFVSSALATASPSPSVWFDSVE